MTQCIFLIVKIKKNTNLYPLKCPISKDNRTKEKNLKTILNNHKMYRITVLRSSLSKVLQPDLQLKNSSSDLVLSYCINHCYTIAINH